MIYITAPAHEILMDSFNEAGKAFLYLPEITYEELKAVVDNATGLIITTRMRIDEDLLRRAKNLKWIGRLGSGLELIDLHFAKQMNIVCLSSPEGNRNAVAEHSLGLLLSLLRKINSGAEEVKNMLWLRHENRGTELTGKTIGIIGFGNTGRAFAKLLHSFDVLILAYDKYVNGFGSVNVREAEPDQILKHADVISFNVPLTAETRYMANASFFEAMKQKPVLLNTSRGEVVDTTALIDALKEEKISAAGLDVLENEKLSTFSPLQQQQFAWLTTQPNVIITPHIAGYTHEAYKKMSEVIVKKLKENGFL